MSAPRAEPGLMAALHTDVLLAERRLNDAHKAAQQCHLAGVWTPANQAVYVDFRDTQHLRRNLALSVLLAAFPAANDEGGITPRAA